MKNNLLGIFCLVVIFLGGFFLINQPPKNLTPENIKQIKIAGQNIKVDLAFTKEAQEQGLGSRSGLMEDRGMLFIFDKPGKYSFWMKDMNFPIDIIWIAENMEIVYIEKNAKPESYPTAYTPLKDAKYVLEVTAGFSKKNNLEVGSSVLFTD